MDEVTSYAFDALFAPTGGRRARITIVSLYLTCPADRDNGSLGLQLETP